MEQACAAGLKTLVALCLENTSEATLRLLQDCASQADLPMTPTVVICSEAWAHFEAGDQAANATAIANAIRAKIAQTT
jgi:hypothetical protein